MHNAASVSYIDLIRELQRRFRLNQKWDDKSYVESLMFDLHMAQKTLQRAVYDQQVRCTNSYNTHYRCAGKTPLKSPKLQTRLHYPDR